MRTESRQIVTSEVEPVISESRQVIASRRERLRSPDYSYTRPYREVTDVVRNINPRECVYVDYRGYRHYRRIRPSFHFALWYNCGPYWSWSYFYPYYHRRYLFVSLGGYWPIGYNYRRYYWYGCHPYYWYGYYPIAREVYGETYNYYTYNYYYDDSAPAAYYDTGGEPPYADHPTIEEMAQEPAEPTLADRYFEDAVNAFEAGSYENAADLFAQAMALAPDDMILPFAYAQALFAEGRYIESAESLRTALAKVTPEEEGVFYPRGLYTDEDVLYQQIDLLVEKAEIYGFDGDLQFLLGYQLLGIGETEAAIESLRLANLDLLNAPSAAVLLSLAEKLSVETVHPSDE